MTNAEKALEDYAALPHEPDCTPTVRDLGCWVLDNEEVIIRALKMADAIDSGELIKYVGPTCDYEPLQYGEVTGWNDCLEHLKKIGGGE